MSESIYFTKIKQSHRIIHFHRFFTLDNQAKWRNQEVLVTVKVPKGEMVHLDKDLDQMQFDFENLNNLRDKEMT
ncbi:MAG: hypothetical protein Q7J86_11205 [Bacteroidota bacterium]|nr:hypothetical protein [Bacteroidota bacterium]MDO9615075.1 hypothetical protein [Bacteroidota bacterium]